MEIKSSNSFREYFILILQKKLGQVEHEKREEILLNYGPLWAILSTILIIVDIIIGVITSELSSLLGEEHHY